MITSMTNRFLKNHYMTIINKFYCSYNLLLLELCSRAQLEKGVNTWIVPIKAYRYGCFKFSKIRYTLCK